MSIKVIINDFLRIEKIAIFHTFSVRFSDNIVNIDMVPSSRSRSHIRNILFLCIKDHQHKTSCWDSSWPSSFPFISM